MISLGKLAKSFGDRTLFADVSLELNAGARYGLVGANGSGKSTLLAILAGDEPPSDGSVSMPAATRLGVLRQDRHLGTEERILDVAMMGDPAWPLVCEQQALLAEGEAAAGRIADLEERIRAADGYTLPARAGAVLAGLGIGTADHPRPMSTLSGGYQLRVLLGQTLVGKPDLLLLDEPTNHLDILTIRWLEKFLGSFPGCAVVVSHDHRFLDNVATHILDVDYELVTLYPGNYSRFLRDKVATRARIEAEIARQQKIIAEKRAFIERFRYKATKARQAQSRTKQIEKLEKELREPVRSSRRSPTFRFEQQRPTGQQVLAIEGVSKSFGDKRVLSDVSLMVARGERVAILGANGLGKSTLLRLLTDRLAPDQGRVSWGYHAEPGYFPQDHGELLDDPDTTALEYLWSACPDEPTRSVRGRLGALLFSGEDVDKKVGSLSGGEAARLIFGRIMAARPNVLVLDEPTNHLDLEAIEALGAALGRYPGTIVFVSHDRWFVSELATRIVEIRSDGIEDYPGGYAAYLSHCGDDHLDVEQVVLKARQDRAEARAERLEAGDWLDQKRRRGEQRRLASERDRLAAAIDVSEKRLAEIEQLYCQPGFFEVTSAARVAELRAEQAALGPRIEALMAEWERAEEALARFDEDPSAEH